MDTKCVFRLIGLEGVYWRRVFQSFVESIKESGGEIVVFKHVLDEINLIINSARKTYKMENFDIERASAMACQFRFEHYNDAQIDVILYNLNENSALTYDFDIEDFEYEKETDEHQIDYEQFKKILTGIYQESNPDFDAEAKGLTIETDIRSITMVYRMRGGSVPRMVHDVDVLFVTTNTGLAQAAKKYDQVHRKNTDGVPVCLTANYLSTFIWLNKPTNYIKNHKQKLLAYCYAALLPTQEQVNDYLEQINLLRQDKSYSLEQLQYMRENRTLMRLYTLMSAAAPAGKKPTLLESIEQYKERTAHNIKELERKVAGYEEEVTERDQKAAKLKEAAEAYAQARLKHLDGALPFLPSAFAFILALLSLWLVPTSLGKEVMTAVSAGLGLAFALLAALLKWPRVRKSLHDWLIKHYYRKHIEALVK